MAESIETAKRWSTGDEIKFIKNLPKEKVRNYYHSLSRRVHWGKIDSKIIYKELSKLFS